MFDKNTLAQLEAGYQLSRQSQPTAGTTATAKAATNKPFFSRNGTATSLISEGGALGGGLAGAAIGSVVPVVGTVIGGAIGAGLGAFGGRLAENKVRDNRLGVSDAAQEGALSAVLSGPLKGLKYAGTAVKTGVQSGGKATLAEALTAGARAADASTIKNATAGLGAKVGNGLTGASDALATKSLKLNGSKFNTDFANRTGEEVGQFANRFGLVGKDANTIRSSIIQPGQEVYNNGINAIGNISKADVQAAVKDSVSKLASSPLPENKALAQAVTKQADELIAQYGDNIPASKIAELKSAVYGQVDKSITDKAGKNANNTYDLLGNSFRKAINNAADKAGIKVDTQALKQAGLNYKSTSLGDLGNELFSLDGLTKQIDVKGRVGQGSSPLGLLTQVGGTTGGIVGGLPGAVAGATAAKIANNSGTERVVANALGNAGSRLTARAAGEQATPTTLQAALTGGRRALQGVALGSALQGGQSPMADSATNSTSSTTNMPNASNISALSQDASALGNSQVPQKSTNPYDPSNVQEAIQSIISQGGTQKDINAYLETVSAYAALMPKNGNNLNSTQADKIATSDNGINTLNQLEGLYSTAGGGQGKIGGGLANFLAGKGANGNVQAYNDLSQSAVSQLAKAINGGGQVSDADATVIVAALPKVTDSAQVAATKFAALKQRLEAARQNSLYYAGATDVSGTNQ